MCPIFQGLCECHLHLYVPILSLGRKEHAVQTIEKAVFFRSLKKSIIKPCWINFWILFLCHWICTSTVSVLLKSSFSPLMSTFYQPHYDTLYTVQQRLFFQNDNGYQGIQFRYWISSSAGCDKMCLLQLNSQ